MEPPTALAQNGTSFHASDIAWDFEQQTLLICVAASNGADLIQEHDHLRLAPRVRRFFEAYLAADVLRRADLRKSVAYASHRFRFEPSDIPSLQDDLRAAEAIALQTANIACASDVDEMTDGSILSVADYIPLADADAYATLAMSYRYVVGFYATDSALSDLGEAAASLVLFAEREYEIERYFKPSTVRLFESRAARRNEDVASSLDAVSRRLKEDILLTA